MAGSSSSTIFGASSSVQGAAQSLDLALEDRHDYLTLASGKKFEVPFSSSSSSRQSRPKDLVDDAFLRRHRHKVEVHAPDPEVYERIFAACPSVWE